MGMRERAQERAAELGAKRPGPAEEARAGLRLIVNELGAIREAVEPADERESFVRVAIGRFDGVAAFLDTQLEIAERGSDATVKAIVVELRDDAGNPANGDIAAWIGSEAYVGAPLGSAQVGSSGIAALALPAGGVNVEQIVVRAIAGLALGAIIRVAAYGEIPNNG